jgi:hypothetical protein
VLGGAIGQLLLRVGPHKLVGVELGRVGRKGVDVKPRPAPKEFVHESALVDGAAVPEEDHLPAQVPQEVPEKPDDLHPREVGGMEVDVEPQATIGRGHREGRDGGDPVAPVAVAQEGGAAAGRPGPTDVRDEQEPAFVEEREMGATSSGVFLYGAR